MTVFAHSQTTNKLVNANDSSQVSGQDRKIPPALGTNQIAGFGGFRSLASLEKIKHVLAHVNEIPSRKRVLNGAPCTTYNWVRRQVTVNRPQSNRKIKSSTVYPSQFACYAKFLVTRYALLANILLRDGAKECLQRNLEVSSFTQKKLLQTSGRYSLDFKTKACDSFDFLTPFYSDLLKCPVEKMKNNRC